MIWIVVAGVMVLLYYQTGKNIPNLINIIIEKVTFIDKFKCVHDNLDETILIINEQNYSIWYMNDYFFT